MENFYKIEEILCPESCPHCPESRDPDDCPKLECLFYFDKSIYEDKKYHEWIENEKN